MPLYPPPTAGGSGYNRVLIRGQRFVIGRQSTGTTKVLTTASGHGLQVGDTIKAAGPIGGTGYTGTYVLTGVTTTTLTYTGGASSTEGLTDCAGTVGWATPLTQRSDMVMYSPNIRGSDVSSQTQISPFGQWPNPDPGVSIAPLSTSVFANSFTDYETMKTTPIVIPESGVTYTSISCRIQAVSTLGVVRFGIYGNGGGDIAPSRLQQDFGTTILLGGGFAYSIALAISWTPDEAGVYHLAMCFQGGNGTPGAQEVLLSPLNHLSFGAVPFIQSYQVAGVTGALPLIHGGATPTNRDRCPAIRLGR
jgi:hypothetical protein